MRQHQPPTLAQSQSPAAPGAPTAVGVGAAWQALCTHPADAPLVHVDHSHRFHTPADTDSFLNRKKVKAPDPPELTEYEKSFIERTKAFVLRPKENLFTFRDMLNSYYTQDNYSPQFATKAAKQALSDVLDLANGREYTDAEKGVLTVVKGICCLHPLNATGKASR